MRGVRALAMMVVLAMSAFVVAGSIAACSAATTNAVGTCQMCIDGVASCMTPMSEMACASACTGNCETVWLSVAEECSADAGLVFNASK
jgi:hypothetical protein